MPDATTMDLYYRKTRIPVLFENSFCVVLNKPAGLSVQGGEGIKVSLDSILTERIQPRPLLVHRLDRDTSGVILVAKTKESAALFSGGDKNRIIKRYLALCFGIPDQEEGVIDLALDKRVKGKTESRQTEARTFYRRLSAGNAGGFTMSLLELELETGRMHQIRRHLAMTGCPVAGDDKYGDFSLNKKLRKVWGLKNLLLHASRLIIQPLPGLVPQGFDITAPLPEYFSVCLQNLNLV